MNIMEISNARYFKEIGDDTKNAGILATVNGKVVSVPLDPNNRHYAEILRQVKAGELTIQEAE